MKIKLLISMLNLSWNETHYAKNVAQCSIFAFNMKTKWHRSLADQTPGEWYKSLMKNFTWIPEGSFTLCLASYGGCGISSKNETIKARPE